MTREFAGRPAPRSVWFISGPVDFLLAGGGSILLYAVFAAARPDAGRMGTAAAALMWVINWPHFSATSYRLYRSKASARQFPMTALALPLLLLGAVAACFASPMVVAPLFVKLFLLWSPYHFSGQSLGVCLVYARRAHVRLDDWQRRSLSSFIFLTYLVGTAQAEAWNGSHAYYGIALPALGIPAWIPRALTGLMLLAGASLAASIAARRAKGEAWPAWPVLLPAAAQLFWFVPGVSRPGYYVFVPLFHSAQYLLIAWATQMKERGDETRRSGRGFVLWETSRWAALNFAGGVLLFWLLPRAALSTGQSIAFTMPVMIAAVQLHHFFVDGVIWKLRQPAVAEKLLVDVGRLAGEPA